MRLLILPLLVASLPGIVWAAPPSDAIIGIWLNSEKSGYIQIYQTKSGDYAGQVVGATDGDVRRDTENPDPSQRNQSLLGQTIMHSFTYNGEGVWESGRIYDPDNGQTYDAWLALKGSDQLKVHGYIWFSLIGRTELWTRVKGVPKEVVKKVLLPTAAAPGQSEADH